ncbi:MAG: hypothetical protein ACON4U_15310 [Myxococcota bacterium]
MRRPRSLSFFYNQYFLRTNGDAIGGVQQHSSKRDSDTSANSYIGVLLSAVASLALFLAHQRDKERIQILLELPNTASPNLLLLPKTFSNSWTI